MPPPQVVPALDEVEGRPPRLGLAAQGTALDRLTLQRPEEALGDGIVVAVTDTAQRGRNAGLLACRGKVSEVYWLSWSE